MIVRHLHASCRRSLAPAAAFERDCRGKHYPGQIERREIGADEAQADFAAWVAIEIWLTTDRIPAWIEWPAMVEAAAKSLERREEACAAKPDDAGLAERRDAGRAIHQILVDHSAWLVRINAELRAEADQRRAVA